MIWNRGHQAHRENDYEVAHLLYKQSVNLDLRFGSSDEDPYSYEWYAALATDMGNYQLAAKLDGTALRMREERGRPLHKWEQELYNQELSKARSCLGAEKFDQYQQEGKDMCILEAIWGAIEWFDKKLYADHISERAEINPFLIEG